MVSLFPFFSALDSLPGAELPVAVRGVLGFGGVGTVCRAGCGLSAVAKLNKEPFE